MKNSAKKVVKAVVLGIMVAMISWSSLSNHVNAMEDISQAMVKTVVRYKVRPNGEMMINILGDHDDVIEEMEKIKTTFESGTLKSMFLISSLNDTRNTEVHLFVEPKKTYAYLERLQYEGSPEFVKVKEVELRKRGYTIEGYVEYSGDIVPAWAKVIAIKISSNSN